MPVQVHFGDKAASTEAGRSLFEVAADLDIRVPTSCQGRGRCRECMVEVTSGSELLVARTEEEEHLGGALRLSCRARVAADSGRIQCQTMRRGTIQIEETGYGLPDVPAEDALDPAVTRDGDQVLLDGQPIAEWDGPLFGLAIDVGTTTVVARLVDLESGQQLRTLSFENPQRFGGSDVLARVQFDGEHPGKLLRRTLLGYLGHAVRDLGAGPEQLFEVVVAANATMRDLFFGLDVQGLGTMPYRSVSEVEMLEGQRQTTSLVLSGLKSQLPMHPSGRVYGLPLIGCHVGGDTAACLLALDAFDESRCFALMDLGTNTELVLGRGGRLHAASCPAGPAFEGGAIRHGMPALEGAIERVCIDADGGVQCGVIGGGRALGVCGSGLVDLASELLRTGRMNELGRLESGDDRFTLDADGDVFVTEADLAQLAQAKAANVAGLHLVFRDFGLDFSDVDVFYLAGGFARHIDLEAARRIGLLPDLPAERFAVVGNASLEGATRALTSVAARRRLDQSVRGIQHVELETFPEFFHFFAEGVQFSRFDSHTGGPEIVT